LPANVISTERIIAEDGMEVNRMNHKVLSVRFREEWKIGMMEEWIIGRKCYGFIKR